MALPRRFAAYGRFNFINGQLAQYKCFKAGFDAVQVPIGYKAYLVDFDQCLSKSPKYDNYFMKLLNHHPGDMCKVIRKYNEFCFTEEAELAINQEVLDKVIHFRHAHKRPFVAIWTARSLETQSIVEYFLKANGISSHFDARVFCAGSSSKLDFIKALLARPISKQDILVIDDSERNCEAAMQLLPEENVEKFDNIT